MTAGLPLASTFAPSPFAWAWRFNVAGEGEPYPDPSASDIASAGDGFIWAHVNLADARSRGWIAAVAALPPEAKEMLVGPDEHVQLHGRGADIWGIFSDFSREPGDQPNTFVTLHVAVGERYVITARRRPVRSAEEVRAAIVAGEKFPRPTELLEALVVRVIVGLEQNAEKTIGAINDIEDRVLDGMGPDDQRNLGPLRRQAVTLHRQTTGLQRVLARFDDPDRLSEATHVALRRLLQRLESIHHELHVTLERARLLHEEVDSKMTAETNRQLYILTIISTLLLPPTFVTGMFGMNTKGLIFSENENAFVYAMLMCVASALAAYAVLYALGRGGVARGK